MKTVRDFIYLDIERLKSLYSQMFEGVVDLIVETGTTEHDSSDTQSGGFRHSGSSVEERVAEAFYKTESKVLYDHMYNQLEDKLGTAIVVASNLTRQDYTDVLETAFVIKAQGQAEMADYERIGILFEKLNDISSALNYITSFGERQPLLQAVSVLEATIAAEPDRNKKAKMKANLKDLRAKLDSPLSQGIDETYKESVEFITDMFYSDRFEVTIRPQKDSEVVFRGILNKEWLRVSPTFLRALYGGYPAPNWTLVGQVTYLPRSDDSGKSSDHELSDSSLVDAAKAGAVNQPGTMRDAYRNITDSYQKVERTFTDSMEFVEVITWPLAIYRETVVSIG